MKKIKLLTPILGLATISTVIVPITSCANTSNHAWLTSIEDPVKDADGRYTGKYYFGLDNDTYTNNDVDVIINSTNRYDFVLSYSVSGNVLVVTVKYIKEVTEDISVQFDIKISTKSWTQQIRWLSLVVTKIGPTVITDDLFLELYTPIWTQLDKDIKAGKYYHKVNVDFCYTIMDDVTLTVPAGWNDVLVVDPATKKSIDPTVITKKVQGYISNMSVTCHQRTISDIKSRFQNKHECKASDKYLYFEEYDNNDKLVLKFIIDSTGYYTYNYAYTSKIFEITSELYFTSFDDYR